MASPNVMATSTRDRLHGVFSSFKTGSSSSSDDDEDNGSRFSRRTILNAASAQRAQESVESIFRALFGPCTGGAFSTMDPPAAEAAVAAATAQREGTGVVEVAGDGAASVKSRRSRRPQRDRQRDWTPSRKRGAVPDEVLPIPPAVSASRSADRGDDGQGNFSYAQYYAEDHARARADEAQKKRAAAEVQRPASKSGSASAMKAEDKRRINLARLKQLGAQHQLLLSRNDVTAAQPLHSRQPQAQATNGARISPLQPYQGGDIPRSRTIDSTEGGSVYDFDDGISALSAHTLEEMVRRQEADKKLRQNTHGTTMHVETETFRDRGYESSEKNVTLDVSKESSELFPPSPTKTEHSSSTPDDKENGLEDQLSPLPVSRSRTNNTRMSHATRDTVHTGSTGTTTEFESVWRKDEARYWNEVAEGKIEDGCRKNAREEIGNDLGRQPPSPPIAAGRYRDTRSRSRSRSNERKPAVTPYHSPLPNSPNNIDSHPHIFLRHPHETTPVNASDISSSLKHRRGRMQKAKAAGSRGHIHSMPSSESSTSQVNVLDVIQFEEFAEI